MSTTSDARGYNHKLILSPDTNFSLTVTFAAPYAVGVAGNWAATVVHNAYDAPSATLITPTIAVSGQAVTVTFTAANLTTLLATGQGKFSGYWKLRNTATPLNVITAPFVVDRNGSATGTADALGLTVSGTTVTATITAALPLSAVDSLSITNALIYGG